MIKVENCKNWQEMSMARGKHCFNCVNRNGFPYRAQPDKNCAKFERLTKRAPDKGGRRRVKNNLVIRPCG